MEFSSKLLENAVNEISQLPGIGKRTALRLALHLLKQPKEQVTGLAQSLTNMRDHLKFCKSCHNISDRSEEHTSELQSRLHLVCRLLLEKKKNK